LHSKNLPFYGVYDSQSTPDCNRSLQLLPRPIAHAILIFVRLKMIIALTKATLKINLFKK